MAFPKGINLQTAFSAVCQTTWEHGALGCRAALYFLGIAGYKPRTTARRKTHLKQRDRVKKNDLVIESFGLPKISVSDLRDTSSVLGRTQKEVYKACVATINVADKAIAHWTEVGAGGGDLMAQTAVCGQAVIHLIDLHLYSALGSDRPSGSRLFELRQ